jgi:ABC-type amino acid transport substrate-binding protein
MQNFKFFLKGLCFFVLASLFLVGCKQGVPKSNNDDSIFANNTIKVGYLSNPPGFFVDPNTNEKSGIFNDVLEEIAKRNGLTIDYKEQVAWATIIEVLKLDKVDFIANPVWATPERRENADFSIPIYFSPIGIYVRANDNRFDTDFSKINDPKVRIAALDGEINYYIGKSDFPLAELKPLPNNVEASQLFVEVQLNKKDVYFCEPMQAHLYMSSNPGKLKNIAEKSPIRNFSNAYMYKKGNTKLGEFLNAEIEKLLEDGTIDKIIDKYAPFKGAVISATDALAVERL